MSSSARKKMLYISVQDLNENPHFLFEVEEYYSDPHRLALARNSFTTMNKEEIIADVVRMDCLGFDAVCRLIIRHNRYLKEKEANIKSNIWALAAYTDEDKTFSILYDEERYRHNPLRHFCATLPLKSLSREDTIRNEIICMRVARIVVQNLL